MNSEQCSVMHSPSAASGMPPQTTTSASNQKYELVNLLHLYSPPNNDNNKFVTLICIPQTDQRCVAMQSF